MTTSPPPVSPSYGTILALVGLSAAIGIACAIRAARPAGPRPVIIIRPHPLRRRPVIIIAHS